MRYRLAQLGEGDCNIEDGFESALLRISLRLIDHGHAQHAAELLCDFGLGSLIGCEDSGDADRPSPRCGWWW